MRKLLYFAASIAAPILVGCTEAEPRAVAGSPPKLAFDPGLALKWPGTPEEDSRVTPFAGGGEMRTYSAKVVDKGPKGAVIYSAYVDEYPEAALKDTSITDHMIAKAFAFRDHEKSRKEIKHGPAKRPGLEIVMQFNGITTREVLVAAGARLYHLTATSKHEELLKTAAADDFFASLAVDK